MKTLIFSTLFLLSSNLIAQECRNEIRIRAVINGLFPEDTIISYKKLLSAKEIVAEAEGYEILRFTATFGNCPVEFSVSGSKLSDSNRKSFEKLRPGDRIYFSQIKAKFTNGPALCLKSFYYRIVE